MASREQFSSKTGFVMAAAGSAVGLGNIWSFPTQAAGHGGAAFVLVYFVLAFCLAYPALVAELIIGRHTRANMVTALRGISISPITRLSATGVGVYGVIVASLILSFYAIVAGFMVAYLLDSLAGLLGLVELSDWLTRFGLVRNWVFMALFMGLTMAVIAKGVNGGIERWSTRLMPILLLIMIGLIIYVLKQEGASEGLRVYLIPDLSQIKPTLILNAMGQAFFSLSLGVGTMLIYGSYLSRDDNLPKLGAAVTLFDTSIAFIAGLLIVPAIFVAQEQGATIFSSENELIAGPDLIFQVLPSLFNSMGTVGAWVALAFFILMTIAALTSSISMLEVPVSLVAEEAAVGRNKATLIAGLVVMCVSTVILFYFESLFNAVIDLTTVYSQPLLGVMLCVFVGWVWHRDNLLRELKQGFPHVEQTLFWKIWPVYVKFACPVLIFSVFVQSVVG